MNKQKTWFDGLKFAESLGYKTVFNYVTTNEFTDSTIEFVNGVLDYLDHCQERLGVDHGE